MKREREKEFVCEREREQGLGERERKKVGGDRVHGAVHRKI